MAKPTGETIINTNGQALLDELHQWISELDGSIVDSITEEILETVIDIIYDNSECECYENI